MNDLVSVVIPAYNTGYYVSHAIESVLAQSYPNIQIVLINDGSVDKTDREIERYLPNDRIKYIYQDNMGPSATRNVGIINSDGSLIAFLDSDDIWLPNKIEKQLNKLYESGADIIYSGRKIIDKAGNPLSHIPSHKFYRGYVLEKIYIDNFICMSSVLIKKTIFNDIGLFDTNLKMSEDYEFWLRAATKYVFDYVDESLVEYRIHSAQASSRYLERLKAIEQIYDMHAVSINRYIPKQSIDKSKALHFCNYGFYYKSNGNKSRAFLMYAKALLYCPYQLKIFKYMLGLLR